MTELRLAVAHAFWLHRMSRSALDANSFARHALHLLRREVQDMPVRRGVASGRADPFRQPVGRRHPKPVGERPRRPLLEGCPHHPYTSRSAGAPAPTSCTRWAACRVARQYTLFLPAPFGGVMSPCPLCLVEDLLMFGQEILPVGFLQALP
ncbi:hypothetical protein OHU34_42370 [Streptomyces sp. NBC_00080]|uniref:hypothetical protein n=1 Tax=Streptomyces sp. NBC_00080 TaxID=2975645 RepID=UPI003249DABD